MEPTKITPLVILHEKAAKNKGFGTLTLELYASMFGAIGGVVGGVLGASFAAVQGGLNSIAGGAIGLALGAGIGAGIGFFQALLDGYSPGGRPKTR